jgi:hypothetical protein
MLRKQPMLSLNILCVHLVCALLSPWIAHDLAKKIKNTLHRWGRARLAEFLEVDGIRAKYQRPTNFLVRRASDPNQTDHMLRPIYAGKASIGSKPNRPYATTYLYTSLACTQPMCAVHTHRLSLDRCHKHDYLDSMK